jgi:hypothetical protein
LMTGSWNMYSYGLNNPLLYIDPSGRCSVKPGESVSTNDVGAPCELGPGQANMTVTEKAPKVRDVAAEVHAEMARMQYDSMRRTESRNRTKEEVALSPNAQAGAQAIHNSLAYTPTLCGFGANVSLGFGGRVAVRGDLKIADGNNDSLSYGGQVALLNVKGGGAAGGRVGVTFMTGGSGAPATRENIRIGGVLGGTVGLHGSEVTSVGANVRLGSFFAVGVYVDPRLRRAYGCGN